MSKMRGDANAEVVERAMGFRKAGNGPVYLRALRRKFGRARSPTCGETRDMDCGRSGAIQGEDSQLPFERSLLPMADDAGIGRGVPDRKAWRAGSSADLYQHTIGRNFRSGPVGVVGSQYSAGP